MCQMKNCRIFRKVAMLWTMVVRCRRGLQDHPAVRECSHVAPPLAAHRAARAGFEFETLEHTCQRTSFLPSLDTLEPSW